VAHAPAVDADRRSGRGFGLCRLAGLIAGGGSLREAFTDPASSELGSLPGTVALVEAAAFLLAALHSPWRTRWAWLAPAVIVGAEGLRAHPGDYQPGWGVLLTIAHLAAGGVVGRTRSCMWPVTRCAGALTRPAVWMLIRDYARLAGWLFLAVLATGTLSTLVVVPLSKLVGTGYGQILLVKTGLVLAAATCALAARRRLRRRGRGLPLRLVGVEAGLLATVLVVTAVLTTVAPPRGTHPPRWRCRRRRADRRCGRLSGRAGRHQRPSQHRSTRRAAVRPRQRISPRHQQTAPTSRPPGYRPRGDPHHLNRRG